MRVAICDDDRNFANYLTNKIKELEEKCEIVLFESGEEFVQTESSFDIVLLDIEMKELNGFETARAIKERNPEFILSFVTSHNELAVDAYDYQPFRYILKQAPEQVIHRKLKEVIAEFHRRNAAFEINCKGGKRKVYISKIKCVEIIGHSLKLTMTDDEIVLWNKPLREVEREMEKCGVIRCHRSFMVALSHIKSLGTREINLFDGQTIPRGRLYAKHVEEKYINYKLK